jgi:Glyoxalase/Bleomycin resistance protein/Dioxygenase superfamily
MSRIFGAITQNGYVVRDIEAAMRHWIDVLGVGPWFYVERAPIEDFQYRGKPSPVEVSIALANSGACLNASPRPPAAGRGMIRFGPCGPWDDVPLMMCSTPGCGAQLA